MSRFARKVDANHVAVVKAFRASGCSVTSLASVGRGVPDLLVGLSGRNVLVEVKTPDGHLTSAQDEWFRTWRGALPHVVTSAEEALGLVRAFREKFGRGT